MISHLATQTNTAWLISAKRMRLNWPPLFNQFQRNDQAVIIEKHPVDAGSWHSASLHEANAPMLTVNILQAYLFLQLGDKDFGVRGFT